MSKQNLKTTLVASCVLLSVVTSSLQAMPPRLGPPGSQTVRYTLSFRHAADIPLHRFIMGNQEGEALGHIDQLTDRHIAPRVPQRLYMSANNCPGAIVYPYTTPDGAHRRTFYAIPYKNIFEVNAEFQTALHLAANMGMVRVVEKLIALGVDINFQDGYGRTALMWAAMCPEVRLAEKIIDLLIQAGANLAIRSLDHRAVRQYALGHIPDFSIRILNRLTVNQLDAIATLVHGMKKLPSDLAREKGQASQARVLELDEVGRRVTYRLELRENKSKRNYSKSDDREAIESILSLLNAMFALQSADMDVPGAISVIKQALALIGSICWGIDKETKGGYLTHLLWPEWEYLQVLMGGSSQEVVRLLPIAFQRWQQSDFPEFRKRLREMLEEYAQWEEKNAQSSANVEPTIPERLMGLHAFVRYFFDLQSLDTIIELSNVAEKLDMTRPESRRELLTIVRKIGDTSKYEVKGANLSPSIKGLAPEVPWDSLHKLRNILKESTQKVPEVRKLLKLLVKDGVAQGLSLEFLREDVVLLGRKLHELKRLMRIGAQDPRGFLDAIRNLYAQDTTPHENEASLLFLQDEDVQTLEAILTEAFNASKFVLDRIDMEKKEKENTNKISDNRKIPKDKKTSLVQAAEEKILRLQNEVAQEKQKKIAPLIKKLRERNSFSNEEISKITDLIPEGRQGEFFQAYYQALQYRSFGIFVSALNIGAVEKEGDRTQAEQAHYLKLACSEWDGLLNILFPDAAQRAQVLRAIENDAPKTNEAAKRLGESLQNYRTDASYRIKLNTIIIDFMLYLKNAGIPLDMTMRNIMEHFNAPHDVYQAASDYQVFSELLRYIGTFKSELNKRISEFKENGVALPTDDADALFTYAPSPATRGAIGALSSGTKINKPQQKEVVTPSVQMQILPIAPNGHCMFNSTLHGIQQFPQHILLNGTAVIDAGLTVQVLREKVATEIEANMGLYFDQIVAQFIQNIKANELHGYPADLQQEMQALYNQLIQARAILRDVESVERKILRFVQTDAVKRYVAALKNGSLWGGDLELGILARLLGVQLRVYKRDGMVYLINDEAVGAPIVMLDYTGDHYNLILNPTTSTVPTVAPQAFVASLMTSSFDEQERAAYKSGDPSGLLPLQPTQTWGEMVDDASQRGRGTLSIYHPTALNGGAARLQVLEIHQNIEPAYAELTDAGTYVLCGTVDGLSDRSPLDDTLEFTGESLIINGWTIPIFRRKKQQVMIITETSNFQDEPPSHGGGPDQGPGSKTSMAPSVSSGFQQQSHQDGPPPANDQQGGGIQDALGISQDDHLLQGSNEPKKSDGHDFKPPPSGTSFFTNVWYVTGVNLIKTMVSILPTTPKYLRKP